MAQSARQLDLRLADDRTEMLEVVAQRGIDLRPEVLEFCAFRPEGERFSFEPGMAFTMPGMLPAGKAALEIKPTQ